jgi:uncharacterized protein (DUF697 family)
MLYKKEQHVLKFGGIGNVWSTIREINVSEIREQAEQPVRLAILGTPDLRQTLMRTLYEGPQRYNSGDYSAIEEYDLPLQRSQRNTVGRCDLVIFAVDTRNDANTDVTATAETLAATAVPCLILLVGEGRSVANVSRIVRGVNATTVVVPDLQSTMLAQRLLPAILEGVPEDQRLATARRLPGLRDIIARQLVGETSFSNATYALTSGIPQMVPLLNIPLNAADIVVLTKNQALMVYKLALAFGAPPDFQAQMRDIMPVIGGGFMWRQVARQLVGLIPGLGIAPKVAVAYAGTYATGQAAIQWYRNGEVLSRDALRKLYGQSLQLGKQRARELIQRRQSTNGITQVEPNTREARFRRLLGWFRRNPQNPDV